MAKFQWNDWLLLWFLKQEFFTFQWDIGNQTKNFEKHGITCLEAESVFANQDKLRFLGVQISPEVHETRYGAFGTTDKNKSVIVCFTIKEENVIRIISIREIYRKEITLYAKLREE